VEEWFFSCSWASDSPGTEVSTEAVASTTQGPPPHNLTLSSSAGLELWTGRAWKIPYFGASYWHWQDGESIIADARQVNAIWDSHSSEHEDNLLDVMCCCLVDKYQHVMRSLKDQYMTTRVGSLPSRKMVIFFREVMLSLWLLIVERVYFITSSENVQWNSSCCFWPMSWKERLWNSLSVGPVHTSW